MADFQTDYSGMAGAGSAFNSFATAFQDAQDRQVKQQEMKARTLAMQTQMQREAEQSEIERRKQGFQKNAETGALEPATLTPMEQSANKLKAFGEGAQETGYDQYGNPSGYKINPQSPKAIAAANAGMKFQTGENDKHNKDFEDFAKTINNPSSRAQIGRLQTNIDRAGTLNALANSIGVPEGQQVPQNESRGQRIARFNNATPSQLYELGSAADQLVNNAKGTVYGTGHLIPSTMDSSIALIRQYMPSWAAGNKPVGANAGEFVNMFLDQANRESNYYKTRRDQSITGVSAGYRHLQKLDPERYEDILKSTTQGMESQPQQQAPPPQATGLVPGGLIPKGMVGGQQAAPPQTFTPDVMAYAQKHGITNEAAQAVKDQRGGK